MPQSSLSINNPPKNVYLRITFSLDRLFTQAVIYSNSIALHSACHSLHLLFTLLVIHSTCHLLYQSFALPVNHPTCQSLYLSLTLPVTHTTCHSLCPSFALPLIHFTGYLSYWPYMDEVLIVCRRQNLQTVFYYFK